jgi:hypothetical protein
VVGEEHRSFLDDMNYRTHLEEVRLVGDMGRDGKPYLEVVHLVEERRIAPDLEEVVEVGSCSSRGSYGIAVRDTPFSVKFNYPIVKETIIPL